MSHVLDFKSPTKLTSYSRSLLKIKTFTNLAQGEKMHLSTKGHQGKLTGQSALFIKENKYWSPVFLWVHILRLDIFTQVFLNHLHTHKQRATV